MEKNSKSMEKVKLLWAVWDVRLFMLASLLIQVLLTFLAPLRKRYANGPFIFLMWLLYLSADAVALYTIGLVSSREKTELLAFWAPFLLLHLGGADTITALALEDNELWHRHALQLTTQVGVTLYVFSQSFRHSKQLLLPTMLMFVDGCIKYGERICALYFASADAFRESVTTEHESGPSYSWLMEEYYAATEAHIPATLQRRIDFSEKEVENNTSVASSSFAQEEGTDNNQVSEIKRVDFNATEEEHRTMVKEAYYFYSKFKGLIAETFIDFEVRRESREFFLRPGLDAFKMIAIELNIMYDVFYTKAFLLQRKRAYLRAFTFTSVITSLLLFSLKDQRNYDEVDLLITFFLLGGAIVLDLCAAVVFIMSDWWIIIMSRDGNQGFIRSLLLRLMNTGSKWVKRRSSRGRWSETISQYNLLKRCMKDPPSILKIMVVKRIKDSLIGFLYGKSPKIEDELLKFILDELRMKAKLVSDDLNAIKEVCSARGNLVLQNDYSFISEYLNPWTLDIDYDESVLTWHFATDLCYLSSEQSGSASNDKALLYRRVSKTLSEYMSYLLLTKKTMVSAVVGKSDMLFEDTRAEVKKYMNTKMLDSLSGGISQKAMKSIFYSKMFPTDDQELEFLQQFSKRVLESYVRPMVDKGDKSKYVLFNARHLAQQLNMIGDKQWEIMSKVWLELLCYAALRCSPRSHVAQLSKGGELITLVWLLMTHLGLAEYFLQNQGLQWTKLIIPK